MTTAEGPGGGGEGAENYDGGVAKGEHESDGDGALALLHELAGDVVDGRNVVGVDGVAQAERIREEGRAQQNGIVVEGEDGPEPGGSVEQEEKAVNARS